VSANEDRGEQGLKNDSIGAKWCGFFRALRCGFPDFVIWNSSLILDVGIDKTGT